MPSSVCHLAFGEMVYRKLVSDISINKANFMSGNLLPDLVATDKSLSHYRKKASVYGLFVPDMEQVHRDLFILEDSVKLGMYAHLYLDYHFIEGFLIPEFIWDKPRMKIGNPRTGEEWDPEPFFKPDGIYYGGFNEIDQLLIKKGYVSRKNISELPEILPKTGMEIFDNRKEGAWKTEIEECLELKEEYIVDVFDCERLVDFIKEISIKLTDEIIKNK